MPGTPRLPSSAEVAALNIQVAAMVAARDGAGLRRTFEHKTVPFLFLSGRNMAGALPLINREVGARALMLAPQWLPSDLLQLSPAGMRWFLEKEGYTSADVSRAITARAAVAKAVARTTFVEDPIGWERLRMSGPAGPGD